MSALSALDRFHTGQESVPWAISGRVGPLILQDARGPYWLINGPTVVVQLEGEKGLVIRGEPGPVTGRINQQRSQWLAQLEVGRRDAFYGITLQSMSSTGWTLHRKQTLAVPLLPVHHRGFNCQAITEKQV